MYLQQLYSSTNKEVSSQSLCREPCSCKKKVIKIEPWAIYCITAWPNKINLFQLICSIYWKSTIVICVVYNMVWMRKSTIAMRLCWFSFHGGSQQLQQYIVCAAVNDWCVVCGKDHQTCCIYWIFSRSQFFFLFTGIFFFFFNGNQSNSYIGVTCQKEWKQKYIHFIPLPLDDT